MEGKNKQPKAKVEKTLEEVQFEEHLKTLEYALRVAGIQTDPGVLDVFIRVDRLVTEHGNQITIREILEIQAKYGKEPKIQTQPGRPGKSGNPQE